MEIIVPGLYFKGVNSDFGLLYTKVYIMKENSDPEFWFGLFQALSSVKSNILRLSHSSDKAFTQQVISRIRPKPF